MSILRIAINSPLRQLFDYLPPKEMDAPAAPQPGCRVLVPFGQRKLCGVLVSLARSSELPADKLRPAIELLDPEPLISPQVFRLCEWAANYYAHPPGEVFAAALPQSLRQGKPWQAAGSTCWELTLAGKGLPEGALKRAPRQAELLRDLLLAGPLSTESLRERGHGSAARRALLDKGLVQRTKHLEAPRQPVCHGGPALSPQQAEALQTIESAPAGFSVWLLAGVTGSGKTEVYLRLVARELEAGRQALILVPEIGLTPQLVQRLQARFDARIAALHSGLADGARDAAWEAARSGAAHIVIGTRSAVFCSLARPGLIVVDEEHDASFKQQDGFRYSARDLAVKRGQLENVPVLLGSATPSLETIYNAHSGRYRRLQLTRRVGGGELPTLDVLDIRKAPLDGGLSVPLLDSIGRQLESGNQALLFLNRRGYAPTLQCHDCGFIASCRHCDARMTLHRRARELRCHHCEWRLPMPNQCPACHGRQLDAKGVGTERTEAALRRHFPDNTIYRVDRDTMQRRDAMAELVAGVNSGEPCILLGTQMLTKGHHFPDVTLVGLLDTDAAMFSGDFRGAERLGQLLTQVSGRAGRADKPGQVILQTHFPDHPLLAMLLKSGYGAFAMSLLGERQRHGLPPFAPLSVVRSEAGSPEQAERFLARLRQELQPGHAAIHFVGPLPAPLQRKSGRFRAQLLLLGRSRGAFREAVEQLVSTADSLPESKRLRWSLDIDPIDTL